MSSIVAVESISLDGVMQAPGRADEDRRGGFEHGGWAIEYNDEVMGQTMARGMSNGGVLLLGRRTYEDFCGYWPQQTDNPYTEVLNNSRKYVVSTTLHEPLPWQNSTLLSGDVVAEVRKLKEQPGKDLVVLGSGRLMKTLLREGLVDQIVLLIHPLVLGSGRRLFADGAPTSRFSLLESITTTTGVVIATYQQNGS